MSVIYRNQICAVGSQAESFLSEKMLVTFGVRHLTNFATSVTPYLRRPRAAPSVSATSSPSASTASPSQQLVPSHSATSTP